MSDAFQDVIDKCSRALRMDFSSAEFAQLAADNAYSVEAVAVVNEVFEYICTKKEQATIQMLMRISRLPLKHAKTFENFDFSVLKGKDIERLRSLPSLAPIYAHRNLAFIGPAGTGKTHLAMAFGYECCQHGMKTYFIKASELRDKFTNARRLGKEASTLTALVRPSCLIIDEVGHCEFDKENTRLFFDMVDRRYNKENFKEADALLCSLDRIFDDALVFNIRGESFRGKRLENIALQAGTPYVPMPTGTVTS